MYHKIHPFKVYSVFFNIITRLCNYHHYLIIDNFHYCPLPFQRNAIPIVSHSPFHPSSHLTTTNGPSLSVDLWPVCLACSTSQNVFKSHP